MRRQHKVGRQRKERLLERGFEAAAPSWLLLLAIISLIASALS